MRQRKHFVFLWSAVLLLMMASLVQASTLTVAVMPFKEGGYLSLTWRHKSQLLDGIAQMITDRLAGNPQIVIVERDRINEVIAEQRFQYSGMIDTSTAVEMGRLMGADILIMGTLNEFGWQGQGGVKVGPLAVQRAAAQVTLSTRLIDVETARLLGSLQAEGEHTGTSLSVRDFQGISFGSKEFSDSTIGQALKNAVDDFISQFESTLSSAETRLHRPVGPGAAGMVVAIRDDYVIIDLGAKDGIRERMQLPVFRLEKIEGLVDPVRIPVGALRVVSVDPNASVAVLIKESLPIQPGDIVSIAGN